MSDLQPDSPPPTVESAVLPPAAPTVLMPPAPAPKKSRRNVFIIAGAAVLGLCLCVGICGLTFGSGIFKSITEKPKVESVIDQFMSAMADKDTAKAYALFSTRSKRHTNLADLEKLLIGNNYGLFDGYLNEAITNLKVSAAFNTNPDLAQGTVATAAGTISYTGGFAGTFNAVLEQEGDTWRLFSVHILVPPDKIGNTP